MSGVNLTAICQHTKNYFEVSRKEGSFSITTGVAPLSNLFDGQYFCIHGSVLNDGVWCNNAEDLNGLKNEEFDGIIISMGVPRGFIELCEDIHNFNTKNADTINSPFKSESYGGYSYTKDSDSVSWQKAFKSRLNEWRKICRVY